MEPAWMEMIAALGAAMLATVSEHGAMNNEPPSPLVPKGDDRDEPQRGAGRCDRIFEHVSGPELFRERVAPLKSFIDGASVVR
jgi:hypothetical protein